VKLYTRNRTDWTKRYPRIVEEVARIKCNAIIDAEVVCLDEKGVPNFDTLHSRIADHLAVACAFDLLTINGDDFRTRKLRQPHEQSTGHSKKMRSPASVRALPACPRRRAETV